MTQSRKNRSKRRSDDGRDTATSSPAKRLVTKERAALAVTTRVLDALRNLNDDSVQKQTRSAKTVAQAIAEPTTASRGTLPPEDIRAYLIKRLMRGLASSESTVRRGFALALNEALRAGASIEDRDTPGLTLAQRVLAEADRHYPPCTWQAGGAVPPSWSRADADAREVASARLDILDARVRAATAFIDGETGAPWLRPILDELSALAELPQWTSTEACGRLACASIDKAVPSPQAFADGTSARALVRGYLQRRQRRHPGGHSSAYDVDALAVALHCRQAFGVRDGGSECALWGATAPAAAPQLLKEVVAPAIASLTATACTDVPDALNVLVEMSVASGDENDPHGLGHVVELVVAPHLLQSAVPEKRRAGALLLSRALEVLTTQAQPPHIDLGPVWATQVVHTLLLHGRHAPGFGSPPPTATAAEAARQALLRCLSAANANTRKRWAQTIVTASEPSLEAVAQARGDLLERCVAALDTDTLLTPVRRVMEQQHTGLAVRMACTALEGRPVALSTEWADTLGALLEQLHGCIENEAAVWDAMRLLTALLVSGGGAYRVLVRDYVVKHLVPTASDGREQRIACLDTVAALEASANSLHITAGILLADLLLLCWARQKQLLSAELGVDRSTLHKLAAKWLGPVGDTPDNASSPEDVAVAMVQLLEIPSAAVRRSVHSAFECWCAGGGVDARAMSVVLSQLPGALPDEEEGERGSSAEASSSENEDDSDADDDSESSEEDETERDADTESDAGHSDDDDEEAPADTADIDNSPHSLVPDLEVELDLNPDEEDERTLQEYDARLAEAFRMGGLGRPRRNARQQRRDADLHDAQYAHRVLDLVETFVKQVARGSAATPPSVPLLVDVAYALMRCVAAVQERFGAAHGLLDRLMQAALGRMCKLSVGAFRVSDAEAARALAAVIDAAMEDIRDGASGMAFRACTHVVTWAARLCSAAMEADTFASMMREQVLAPALEKYLRREAHRRRRPPRHRLEAAVKRPERGASARTVLTFLEGLACQYPAALARSTVYSLLRAATEDAEGRSDVGASATRLECLASAARIAAHTAGESHLSDAEAVLAVEALRCALTYLGPRAQSVRAALKAFRPWHVWWRRVGTPAHPPTFLDALRQVLQLLVLERPDAAPNVRAHAHQLLREFGAVPS